MISWLQNNLQKHFRFVFIVLLVVLVVAFVFTIGNQGPLSGGNERTAKLFFFETPLNTEAARARFDTDAQMSLSLNRNNRASSTFSFERATALHIANEHSIPAPTSDQLREFIETLPAFQNQLGQFDAQNYNMVLSSLRLGGPYTENDLHRVIVDDYRISKVYTALRGAGFVDDAEILDSLSKRLANWSILFAETDLSTYTPEIEITDEMLQKHYEDFSFTYQTPERRIVDFIEIQAGDFVETIKPTEDELITYFEANLDRYQPAPPADENAEPAAPVTFEEARLAVRNDFRLEAARDIASERAHDLVVKIVDNDLTLGSEGFKTALAELKLSLKTSSPFAANQTPIGTTWGRDIVAEAFTLTKDRFYSEPMLVGNRSIILFYNNVIEPIVPAFETLRGRIVNDVQTEAYRKARSERAIELQAKLAAAAGNEDSFGAAAEEAGLTVSTFKDFTLVAPAEGLDRRALSALLNLEAKDVSDFIRLNGENQGAYVYVASKTIPEVSKDDPQYTQVENSLKSLSGQFSAEQYIKTLSFAEQVRIGVAQQAN